MRARGERDLGAESRPAGQSGAGQRRPPTVLYAIVVDVVEQRDSGAGLARPTDRQGRRVLGDVVGAGAASVVCRSQVQPGRGGRRGGVYGDIQPGGARTDVAGGGGVERSAVVAGGSPRQMRKVESGARGGGRGGRGGRDPLVSSAYAAAVQPGHSA